MFSCYLRNIRHLYQSFVWRNSGSNIGRCWNREPGRVNFDYQRIILMALTFISNLYIDVIGRVRLHYKSVSFSFVPILSQTIQRKTVAVESLPFRILVMFQKASKTELTIPCDCFDWKNYQLANFFCLHQLFAVYEPRIA